MVARHREVVFHLARVWSGNSVDADELSQLTFIKAFEKLDRFRAGSNFKAWVLRILRNTYLDWARKQRRAARVIALHLASGESQLLRSDRAPLASMDVQRREVFYERFDERVARALRSLSPGQRFAVLLCDVEGLSYLEVARALGCPTGTVRTWIHRGRLELQRRLRNYARENGYGRQSKPVQGAQRTRNPRRTRQAVQPRLSGLLR